MQSLKKKLHKKAWKLFSEYVRRRDKGKCFTCGIVKDYKEMNAGHYIHKDCMDFDEINIRCQCVSCNLYKSGNLGVYAERLIKKYGLKKVEELRVKSNKVHKFTIEELEKIIETYKKKLEEYGN